MELNDKIKLILESTDLTPSIFADEIGVQRSSISHILAGRNKPSLDVVQKIVKRFPEFGINWILEDEELPIHQNKVSTSKPKAYTEKIQDVRPKIAADVLTERSAPHTAAEEVNLTPPKPEIFKEKKAIKIMVLYSDGTFQEFNPSIPMF